MTAKVVVQELDGLLNHVVDEEKINAENEYRDDHHCRGGLHFLPRWRRNLAGLGAHIVIESLNPLRPGLQPVSKILTGGRD